MSLIGPLLKLESRLKCELCHGFVSRACTLNECGHRFCRRCVFDKIGKERKCPTCQLPAIVKNLRPDPMHDTLVACVRKLGALLSDVQTVDSNALYRSSARNASVSGTPSHASPATQTPSVPDERHEDRTAGTAGSQPPSSLQHSLSSGTRKRASSEGVEPSEPPLLQRTSSEILLRDTSSLQNRCGLPFHFAMPEVELSRREAVCEETHRPSLLRDDDLKAPISECGKSQASDDSQDMVLTHPDDDMGYVFDDQEKTSASSDMPLSYPEYPDASPSNLLEELDACDDALPDDALPHPKRSFSPATFDPSKKRRTHADDVIDPVEVICGASQDSDIMQALCNSKDELPEDELPRPYTTQDFADALLLDMKHSELPDDELPRPSSPEDLLTAMFESKDGLPDDELPPEQRSKRKDTHPRQSTIDPPPLARAQSTEASHEDEQWKCPHCYFMNSHGLDACNLCKQSRGTAPHTPPPLSIPQHASLATTDSIVPTSQWQHDHYASSPMGIVNVMFTGVTPDEAQQSIDAVTASGLTLFVNRSETPKQMDEVTHYVTHRNAKGLSGRTAKYLRGILTGAWIVDIAWLADCSKEKRWLPEQRYEVCGDTVTGITHGPRRGRTRKEAKKKRLFEGIKFNFFDKAHPNRDKLMTLCQAGGGQLLLRRPPADKSGAWRDLDVERSSINPQHPVVIVTEKKQLDKKSAKGLQLYQVREAQWLLDRISRSECPHN